MSRDHFYTIEYIGWRNSQYAPCEKWIMIEKFYCFFSQEHGIYLYFTQLRASSMFSLLQMHKVVRIGSDWSNSSKYMEVIKEYWWQVEKGAHSVRLQCGYEWITVNKYSQRIHSIDLRTNAHKIEVVKASRAKWTFRILFAFHSIGTNMTRASRMLDNVGKSVSSSIPRISGAFHSFDWLLSLDECFASFENCKWK